VDYTVPRPDENLADHSPAFWRWLRRAAGHSHDKQDRILAVLFMVLANRYDWQMFLEVTGPSGSGKSVMASITTLLAVKDNTTSATIDTLESSRERASVVGFSLIILPDQEKWSGDGASIKAITGVDAVAIDPKYRDAYSTHIPEVIPAKERDPQLLNKISTELAVIVRHLMQRFSQPEETRAATSATDVRRGAGDKATGQSAGRFLRLSDATEHAERAVHRQCQYPADEYASLPLSRLPVLYRGQRPSAPHETDGVRPGVATGHERIRDRAAEA